MVNQVLCLEVLFITILTWVAVWGLIDLAVERLESTSQKILLFSTIGLVASILVLTTPSLSTCRLL